MTEKKQECTRCEVPLPVGAFGRGRCWCKLCETIARREKFILRDDMNAFLADMPCADCERVFPPCAMQLDHHPDCEPKEHTIADMMSRAVTRENVQALWAEMVKCEVVCANCHAIRTNKRAEEKHRLRVEARQEYVTGLVAA